MTREALPVPSSVRLRWLWTAFRCSVVSALLFACTRGSTASGIGDGGEPGAKAEFDATTGGDAVDSDVSSRDGNALTSQDTVPADTRSSADVYGPDVAPGSDVTGDVADVLASQAT